MSAIRDRLAERIGALREERKALLAEAASRDVAAVTVAQLVGGMRGAPALVCDTSVVHPDKGLIIRGIPVAHLADKTPEAVFFLLVTGSLPDDAELADLCAELHSRPPVDTEVWEVVDAVPRDAHPMAVLSAALLALEKRSRFRAGYESGMAKGDQWEPALADALDLIALVPELVAGVYRTLYGKGKRITPAPDLDWAANLGHMMGMDDDAFHRYMRLATVVQCDHEGGHASALACHVVVSTLADIYYGVSAGWNALAGPLHGLASQTCLAWIEDLLARYGGKPTEANIREYAQETLANGRVIPGYGHAVLRAQDPRYLAILAFGEKNASRDPLFKTVVQASRVVPSVLMEHGKAKNPWPNVDAINGALFHHFGIEERPFYTVFFAAALTLGFCAQYVLNRVVGTPIMRPRSVTSESLRRPGEE